MGLGRLHKESLESESNHLGEVNSASKMQPGAIVTLKKGCKRSGLYSFSGNQFTNPVIGEIRTSDTATVIAVINSKHFASCLILTSTGQLGWLAGVDLYEILP